MSGINKVTLFGYLGADAELRNTPKGAVCKLRLATTEKWKDKEGQKHERTEWHRATLFGTRAEALAPMLTKGKKLYLDGRLETSSYDKDGQKHWSTSIIVDNLEFGTPANGAYTPAPSGPSSIAAPPF
jgi:single-strand DNA-binding protein